jgi:hypothetical protein
VTVLEGKDRRMDVAGDADTNTPIRGNSITITVNFSDQTMKLD